MKKICVLLPALNEEAHIGQLTSVIKNLSLGDVEVTVLVVNDGSIDKTFDVAQQAGAHVVSHPVNRGVGAAFRTGIEWARQNNVDYFIHMDSDGQISADQIPLIFNPVREDKADFALGSRFLKDGPPGLSSWKKICMRILSLFVGMFTGYRLSDISCGFRCMNRNVLNFLNPHFDYDYIQESLIQALAIKCRLIEVPIHVFYNPKSQKSAMSKRVFRYISRFLVITSYSLFHFYRLRLFNRDSILPFPRNCGHKDKTSK